MNNLDAYDVIMLITSCGTAFLVIVFFIALVIRGIRNTR